MSSQVLDKPSHMPSQANQICYTDRNTLWVKHVKHQKVESSKGSFSFKVSQHGQQQIYLQ